VLLDDLLVAEDLAAAETTSAASHAAAAAAASSVQQGRLQGRYGFTDERNVTNVPETGADGAVVVGNPVAPPINGDINTDISTENAALQDRQMSINSVPKKVIAHLLKPRGWKPPVRRQFFLDCNEIADLCDSAERIASEPSVLQLKAPIKIFGDLHGQFGDLMWLFDECGSPSTSGDTSYIDYLFLGDYVDRGQHSLETITLLLALKVEHPHQIHLIRGNHEAADINALFGFRIECIERMGERWNMGMAPDQQIVQLASSGCINREKNYLYARVSNSLTALLLFCCTRYLYREFSAALYGIYPDRVMEFCNNNDLQLICVMDGFERFAQGHLITLFSATNYCGTANNAGAILVLGRDLVVVPKLTHPLPPALSSPETSPKRHIEDTWMQVLLLLPKKSLFQLNNYPLTCFYICKFHPDDHYVFFKGYHS
ncbi:serine/threonine-protein phosphatase, partial [Striga asiatica]